MSSAKVIFGNKFKLHDMLQGYKHIDMHNLEAHGGKALSINRDTPV